MLLCVSWGSRVLHKFILDENLDKNKFIIGNSFLKNFFSISEISSIIGFVSFKVCKAGNNCSLYNKYETTIGIPPVAFAIFLRSSFLALRTPIAPASTKYLRQRSSIPFI